MTPAFQSLWLYCDAKASMEAPLAVALEVARRHDAVLTLLVVVEQSNDRFLRTPVGQESARGCTEELLRAAACENVVAAVHHPKGEPGTAIPALAEAIRADVVILGSAGRAGCRGSGRYLIGLHSGS